MIVEWKHSNMNMYVVNIVREDVEERRIDSDLLRMFQRRGMFDKIIICFMGYDDDPREIYHIPEVREWYVELWDKVPHLFYYLSDQMHNTKIALLCLLPKAPFETSIEGEQADSRIDFYDFTYTTSRLANQAVEYCEPDPAKLERIKQKALDLYQARAMGEKG